MENVGRITLDDPVLRARLRQDLARPSNEPRPVQKIPPRPINDIRVRKQANRPERTKVKFSYSQIVQPVAINPQPEPSILTSNVQSDSIEPIRTKLKVNPFRGKSRVQLALGVLAGLMLLVGGYISVTAWQADQAVAFQANQLTAEANKVAVSGSGSTNSSQSVLSTVKPSVASVESYAVEPNYPKFLRIPAIGVDARVMQVGVLPSGALGTPNNVFDTAWYTGSAEPDQPGATLIDGHVSSWTSHGVFYNLHTLKPGDAIQIVKGNNQVINYKVVKTQIYGANSVNMQAAITPITPGVSGLNLITCTGHVIRGTSLFNERVIVFAQET